MTEHLALKLTIFTIVALCVWAYMGHTRATQLRKDQNDGTKSENPVSTLYTLGRILGKLSL